MAKSILVIESKGPMPENFAQSKIDGWEVIYLFNREYERIVSFHPQEQKFPPRTPEQQRNHEKAKSVLFEYAQKCKHGKN